MSWYFTYDNSHLSEALQKKLQQFGLLNDIPATSITTAGTRFIKNFFTPDGYPHLGEDSLEDTQFPFIFPAIAPWYTGAAIPAAITQMAPLFRQTACKAAVEWLHTLTSAADPSGPQDARTETFHGLAFQEPFNGVQYTVAFPDTRIETSSHGFAAIVPIADSYWNNHEWEKQGAIPLYARQMAQFQLWCWERFAEESGYQIEAPTTAFVVRICGNLSVDCAIRTVEYNPKEAKALAQRILKAKQQEAQKGLYWKRHIDKPMTWTEKLDQEAFRINDNDQYELVVQFMRARSAKKAIERELKQVSEEMDAIAVKLADQIPTGNVQGKYTLPDGTFCTVTHQKRRTREKKVSPELLRSLFPEVADDFISAGSSKRTYVTIEAI